MNYRVCGSVLRAANSCGEGGNKGTLTDIPPRDATPPDAPSYVRWLEACRAEIGETVTTTASSYVPDAVNVTQGQVVRFMVGGTHDVAPLPGTDPDLVVPLGGDRCYMFTMMGTFRFKCTPHGFTDMVTVQ